MFKNLYTSSLIIKTRFLKKILYNGNYNINIKNKNIILNKIEIIFKLPSVNENRNRFLLMLMLLEKYINNKVIFLIDTRTFSKARSIKVGSIIHLQKEMLINFLYLCSLHSIPKFHEEIIIFEISKAIFPFYEMKKILSNTIFNMDKDINLFYDYLSEFNYVLNIHFRSYINNNLLNQLLLNIFGLYFLNSIQLQYKQSVINSWINILLEEIEEESLDIIENNILENKIDIKLQNNSWQEDSFSNELEIDLLFPILYEEILFSEIDFLSNIKEINFYKNKKKNNKI